MGNLRTQCHTIPQTNKALIRSPIFESLQKYARPPRPYTPGIPTPTGPTPSRLPRHFGGVGNQQSDLEFGKVDGWGKKVSKLCVSQKCHCEGLVFPYDGSGFLGRFVEASSFFWQFCRWHLLESDPKRTQKPRNHTSHNRFVCFLTQHIEQECWWKKSYTFFQGEFTNRNTQPPALFLVLFPFTCSGIFLRSCFQTSTSRWDLSFCWVRGRKIYEKRQVLRSKLIRKYMEVI